MTRYDIVGFGIATIDHFGVVESFPVEDTKQRLLEYAQQGGGTVATPLVTCARLGLRAAYLGRIGVDPASVAIENAFKSEGVDTSASIRDATYEPPVALVIVNPTNHSRTIAWHRKHGAPIDPNQVDENIVRNSRVLYLDAHEGATSLHHAHVARDAGRLVVVDADNYTDDIRPVLPHANVIIGSERFARQFSGDPDAERAAALLYERFGGVCGITAGRDGSYLVTDDGPLHQPAFPVDVIDTTGAGDVYHGAFVKGLLSGWSVRDNARFASAVAAIKCRSLGGQAGIPDMKAAVEFLRERGKTGPWDA